MTSPDDLDRFIDKYHQAAAVFVTGNSEPYKKLFSRRSDVTLGNPFGPFGRGWPEIGAIMDAAAALYRDGTIVGFENLAKYADRDLAYIVEVERFKARMGGRHALSDIALRSTTVLRREGGSWAIVHRHADPITGARPAESVVQI